MIALQRGLVLAVAVVSTLGLAVEAGSAAASPAITEYFSLSYEPTWFSSSLLLASAVAAVMIAHGATSWRRHWWGVATVFGYASIDEASELHEHLGGLIGTGGVLYFDWIIFACAALIALSLIYLRFVIALSPPTRTGLIAAGIIYVVGAVGMELPLGWWTERFGSDGLGYALIDWVEETLEMAGATVALLVLVRHRASTHAPEGAEAPDAAVAP